MVGSSGRGVWQGQGQLEHPPLQLVLGVVRHCGVNSWDFSESFILCSHLIALSMCVGGQVRFLGKEVIKIDVTSHSHVRGRGDMIASFSYLFWSLCALTCVL